MWNNYPNNEVLGYLTPTGQLLVTDIQPLTGGSARGLYKYTDGAGTVTYYYTYPMNLGAPALTYPGMTNNGVNYFIPVVASVHTHTPCRTDGTDGVSHDVGPEDASLAANHPGLRNWVIGCDAIATFSSASTSFQNVQSGPLSTNCASIQ